MKLEGRVALVTGGGRRLGRAIAVGLGKAGCRVAVHYLSSADGARDTVAEIAGGGEDAHPFRADLARSDGPDELLDEVGDRMDGLDILVNSAASFHRQDFEEIGPEQWDAVFALNARAPFLMCRGAARLMRRSGSREFARGVETESAGVAPGAIINLADNAGLGTWRGYAHHGGSKAAVLHLTRQAARELGPDIRVNAIVPGPILPHAGESPTSPEWIARGARTPLARGGNDWNVVHTVLYLAENDYVTGAVVPVDGGEHILPGSRE